MKRILIIVAAILLAVSVSAQQTNLIARWSFDEGNGTNVAAVSGSEACQPQAGSTFNGILEGSPLPVWTNGVSGFGLSFDGVQNQIRIGCREEAQNTQNVNCASCAFLRLARLNAAGVFCFDFTGAMAHSLPHEYFIENRLGRR